MEWDSDERIANSDAELIVDESAELLEDDESLDDKITVQTSPNITIVECEDSQASHRAFCGRCRTISSSFLGTALRSRSSPSYTESCRYDQSIQQYYSVPAPDDIPLLNVRKCMASMEIGLI